jgi:hypothetical protein
MDEDAKRLMKEQDRRRQNAAMLGRETNVVETAAAIESRYRAQAKYSTAESGYGEGDGDGYNMQGVNQQAFMPSVKDPKMWAFKCIPGKEEEVREDFFFIEKETKPDRTIAEEEDNIAK